MLQNISHMLLGAQGACPAKFRCCNMLRQLVLICLRWQLIPTGGCQTVRVRGEMGWPGRGWRGEEGECNIYAQQLLNVAVVQRSQKWRQRIRLATGAVWPLNPLLLPPLTVPPRAPDPVPVPKHLSCSACQLCELCRANSEREGKERERERDIDREGGKKRVCCCCCCACNCLRWGQIQFAPLPKTDLPCAWWPKSYR